MKRLCGKSLVICTVWFAILWISSSPLLAEDFANIKADALKKWIESGDNSILIVDVQPKGAYNLGHIKGAINFPWAAD